MKKDDDDKFGKPPQKSDKKNSLFDESFFDDDDDDFDDDDDDDFDFDDDDDFDDDEMVPPSQASPSLKNPPQAPTDSAQQTAVPHAPVANPLVMPFGGATTEPQQSFAQSNMNSVSQSQFQSGQESFLPNVQFRVGCELGQVLIPYNELSTLEIGNVVNFNNTAQTLTLTINNVKAGEGMLVNVDGKIGIKITRWYGKI